MVGTGAGVGFINANAAGDPPSGTISQSTAQAVYLNALGGLADVTQTDRTEAYSQGNQDVVNSNEPSVNLLDNVQFLTVGALAQEAHANADGSSFSCAGIVGSDGAIQLGDQATSCEITGENGDGLSLDLAQLLGGDISGLPDSPTLELTADAVTAFARQGQGADDPTGDATLLNPELTVGFGDAGPETFSLELSGEPNQNLLTAIVNSLGDQQIPGLSGGVDTLSDALEPLVDLTTNFQRTDSEGSFRVSALHIELAGGGVAEADLAEATVQGNDGGTGNDNTGTTNTGNDNTGNGNTGTTNTGTTNTGNGNTGNGNTGTTNTGTTNTGTTNTGNGNTGNGNTGTTNTGNTGNGNTGTTNTGNDNTGNDNTGNDNTGTTNTGTADSGISTSGDDSNTGTSNTGTSNTDDTPTRVDSGVTAAEAGGQPGFGALSGAIAGAIVYLLGLVGFVYWQSRRGHRILA